jgi:ribose transport system substrate-binding protein
MIWTIGGILLFFMFIISTTDWIIKEKELPIYQISVIIHDSSDEYWINYKKGLERAALEYNVDLSFITLYDKNNVTQQIDFIQREEFDGADAVVLATANSFEVHKQLERMSSKLPIIAVRTDIPSNKVVHRVLVNNFALGKQLGELVTNNHDHSKTIYIYGETHESESMIEQYHGLISVLEERGYSYRMFEKDLSIPYEKIIDGIFVPNKKDVVCVALSPDTMVELIYLIQAKSDYKTSILGLYGVGYTDQILYAMEEGMVDAIVMYNNYTEGYLSILYAVEYIMYGKQEMEHEFDIFTITSKDVGNPLYEKMLFPIY